MTKRLIRYACIEDAMKQRDIIASAGNCSIILKDGKVYTGRVTKLDHSGVTFDNMRLKKQVILVEELSEIIVDIKSE